MQCTGSSGCFSRGKRAAIVRPYHFFLLLFFFPVCSVFCASITHQTMTWSTGSLTCIRAQSYACVYAQGLGTPTVSQHNIFTQKNSHKLFLCSGQGLNLWSLNLESMLYQLSHSVTLLLSFVKGSVLTNGVYPWRWVAAA